MIVIWITLNPVCYAIHKPQMQHCLKVLSSGVGLSGYQDN